MGHILSCTPRTTPPRPVDVALHTIDGSEWDGGSGSWRPVEDARRSDDHHHDMLGACFVAHL
ncbi:hypothetical protein ACIQZB_32935 [Streptomyces sp. NPDC097727]|uniref:hypothetical protein n=1 Tax=Streptomyces sp. NPDC097727 TaxID=3366092 RepID=UPI003813A4BC